MDIILHALKILLLKVAEADLRLRHACVFPKMANNGFNSVSP